MCWVETGTAQFCCVHTQPHLLKSAHCAATVLAHETRVGRISSSRCFADKRLSAGHDRIVALQPCERRPQLLLEIHEFGRMLSSVVN
jgi:hypothetical protein